MRTDTASRSTTAPLDVPPIDAMPIGSRPVDGLPVDPLPIGGLPVGEPSGDALARAAAPAVRRTAELERAIAAEPDRFRVLTGDRPTGPLHVGHYFGSLRNRVRLQRAGVELLDLIADVQAITDRDSPKAISDDVLGIVADSIAAGVDPERATIFTHSHVAAIGQLTLPFLSLVSVGELQRNPTVKAEFAVTGGRAMRGLMFTYPVHQAADILFCRANLVPVGDDQLPHLELTRTIARRFNERYSTYFPLPEPLLSAAPRLLSLDGKNKMSKSRGNSIPLSATADETARLIRGARTDSERRISYDPVRRPAVANLVLLAALCLDREPTDVAESIGARGSGALKQLVTEVLNDTLRPLRSRRAGLAADPAYLRSVLRRGNDRAAAIADQTLAEVRRRMHMDY